MYHDQTIAQLELTAQSRQFKCQPYYHVFYITDTQQEPRLIFRQEYNNATFKKLTARLLTQKIETAIIDLKNVSFLQGSVVFVPDYLSGRLAFH